MVIILPPFEDGSLSETVARMTPEKVQGVMAEIKSGFYKADDLTIASCTCRPLTCIKV